MSRNPISEKYQQMARRLEENISERLNALRESVSSTGEAYDAFINRFIIQGFDVSKAYETAQKLFGNTHVKFIGVDGSMSSDISFDMVLFSVSAYIVEGDIEFLPDSQPVVNYDLNNIDLNNIISSIVPMHPNNIVEADQTLFTIADDGTRLITPVSDEEIIDNTAIPQSLMRFGELFLTYRKLLSDEEIKIAIFDRSLSSEYAALASEMRLTENRDKKMSLIGYRIGNTKINENHIEFGQYLIYKESIDMPPRRWPFIRGRIIHELIKANRTVEYDELLQILFPDQFDKEDIKKAYNREIAGLKKLKFITIKDKKITLKKNYKNILSNLKQLVNEIGERIFIAENEENPLVINVNNIPKWLTTLDVDFLSLITLQMIIEYAWEHNILLIGITKDTSARDFKRQFIPTMASTNNINISLDPTIFDKLPDTDRYILQFASVIRHEDIRIPWSTVEYDSAFRTIIPDAIGGTVFGARKNFIAPTRLFMKMYVQLGQGITDDMLRSYVLAVDRITFPRIDEDILHKTLRLKSGILDTLDIYFTLEDRLTPIQNLMMTILTSMQKPSIPEAMGHNYALFIADKVAKEIIQIMSRITKGMKSRIITDDELRRIIIYSGSFRDLRAETEAIRYGH